MEIELFDSGLNMVFESRDKQAIIADKSWFIIYAEYLFNNGIDPTKQDFILPNGRRAKIIKIDNKYSFQMERYKKMNITITTLHIEESIENDSGIPHYRASFEENDINSGWQDNELEAISELFSELHNEEKNIEDLSQIKIT